MSKEIGENFVAALRELEESRNVEKIASLYAENAEIGNVVAPKKFIGRDGARDFWTKYRETFSEISSEFRNKIHTENQSALEWTTTGKSNGEKDIIYSGVTILEIENGKISRSCAYFNSENLGKQIQGDAPPKENQAVSA
ncbi:MAG: nuclear transport factor 2 family protein [Pyrinomonadaceae bacterium]|nr:nuclear transport factor 2 family protein [Pyrinomonadaceae bacterium]